MGSSLVLNRRPKVPAEDTAAFGAIAERFRRAGALEQAVSLCRDGLKKFPDHVSARVTLGWSLLDLGKYDEARVELEQVMRRAPDNLAAIRGLAELHDRFEHTLNLPMDGPGQWPPPADSVDGDAGSDHAATVYVAEAARSQELETAVPAQAEPALAEPAMAPAAMGLPLWTPEPAASPVAEAVPAPATTTTAPTTTSGSGMSSVREIDAFAGAPVPTVAAQAAAAPESVAPPQVDSQIPEEDDIQLEIDAPVVAIAAQAGVAEEITEDIDAIAALIAEAESLDAAAALEAVVTPDALELGSVEVELADLAIVEPVEETFAAAAVEPVVEHAVEPVLEQAVEPVLEQAAVSVIEETVEPVLEQVLEPALESAVEIESVPEPEIVPEVAAEVAEVISFAARSTAAAENVELEPMELLQDEQEDAIAQVIPMPSKSAATVVALERMLRRVQARRHQLMAESVA